MKLLSLALSLCAVSCFTQVTTSQYDNFRTGATLNEKILTPQNVNPKQFGKLGAFKVDGAVYAHMTALAYGERLRKRSFSLD